MARFAAAGVLALGLDHFLYFETLVKNMRYVIECTKVSGAFDYLAHCVYPDISSYHMLSDELLRLGPKVGNISSYIVLKDVKTFGGVAFDDLVTPH